MQALDPAPLSIVYYEQQAKLAKTDDDLVALTANILHYGVQILEAETNIRIVKDTHDKVAALQAYFARQIQSRSARLQAQNNLAELRIRQECKLGDMLNSMQASGELAEQGRPKRSHDVTFLISTLADYSITKQQAYRWRTMALVPPEELEQEFIIASASDDYELTSYAVYARGKEIRRKRTQQPQTLSPDAYNVILAAPDWLDEHTSIDRLCQFPSQHNLQIADNAALFLWTLNPYLPAALTVLEAWGFTYRTNIARVGSMRRDEEWYLCGRHNLLLVATRGDFDPPDPDAAYAIGTVIATRPRYDAYDLIEQLYPNCRYLKLFADSPRDGWDVYREEGNVSES